MVQRVGFETDFPCHGLPLSLLVHGRPVSTWKNIWATSALVLMTIGLLAFLARQETKPNSAVVSEDGVVLLRKTPFGQTALRSIAWSSMTECQYGAAKEHFWQIARRGNRN
jgi:hypothetical protein